MPLRHSPRASPSRQTTSGPEPQTKANVSRSASITSVVSDNDSSTTDGITVRKRKRSDEGMKEFREEIMQMFTLWKTEHDKKMTIILNTVNEIREQSADIRISIDLMSKNYDDLMKKIDKLEIERENNIKYIKVLENKIEQIERGQNFSRIELRGVPRKQSETKKNLVALVQSMGKALRISVEAKDISDVYRTNTKSEKSKPIIVQFNSVLMKEDMLRSLKAYNRDNVEKFNTLLLQVDGPPSPVFISESLTPQARKLFATARMFAKDNGYRYCWTSFGKIYLRKSEGDKLIRVDSDQDLHKLK